MKGCCLKEGGGGRWGSRVRGEAQGEAWASCVCTSAGALPHRYSRARSTMRHVYDLPGPSCPTILKAMPASSTHPLFARCSGGQVPAGGGSAG